MAIYHITLIRKRTITEHQVVNVDAGSEEQAHRLAWNLEQEDDWQEMESEGESRTSEVLSVEGEDDEDEE